MARGRMTQDEERNTCLFAFLAAFSPGCLRLFLSGGLHANFVGHFVSCAFKGSPHVPACDGAVGPPALAEFQEFLWFGHMFLAVRHRPALLDPEVVNWENVGASQAEDQEHLYGPGADAADRNK